MSTAVMHFHREDLVVLTGQNEYCNTEFGTGNIKPKDYRYMEEETDMACIMDTKFTEYNKMHV